MPSTAPPNAIANPAKPAACQSLGLTLSAGDEALLADLSLAPQTIGSGPRCSVRLVGPGLRPMHCVVTPTAEGPVVRRWAAETLLNGVDFTESLLTAGDRLQIGSLIELSVVDLAVAGADCEPVVDEPIVPIVETEVAEEAPPVESLESPAVEPPTAEEAPAESVAAEDEWFDAGIESIADHLQEITSDQSVAETPAIDPAIPGHLLQPWASPSAEDQPTPPVGKRDTASVVVPLNSFKEAPAESEAVVEQAADWEPAATEAQAEPATESAGLDWAVPTPCDEVEADESLEGSLEEPAAEAVDTWAAEFTAEPSAEPHEDFASPAYEGFAEPNEAAQTFDSPESFEVTDESTPAVEIETVEPPSEATREVEADSLAESVSAAEFNEKDEAFQAATAQVAKLRDCLRSNRHRVAGLVVALKQRREEIASLELAVGERDQLISDLQGHLQDALEVGEAARAELAQWQEAADAAADEEPTVEEVVAALNPQIEEEIAAAEAEAEQIAADIAATAPTDPGVESIEAYYAPPAEEPPAEGPPVEPTLETSAEAEEAPAAQESLWGIEQLAETDQPPVAEAAPHWEAPAETPAAFEPSPAVAEAPVGSQGDVDSEEDEPAVPTVAKQLEDLEEEPAAFGTPAAEATDVPAETESAEASEEPVEEERVEIGELIAKAAAKTAFDPLANAEETPHEAPASFIEQYAHTLPDDDEPVDAPAPIEPIGEPASEMAPESVADGEDDESVDDYMRKLMERIRGESSPATPDPESAKASAAPKPRPSTEDQAAAAPEPAPQAAAPMKCLSEMKRGPVRQAQTDMGALRQLANQSARHAIDVANTRDNREQATLRLVGSAVAVGCGLLAVITSVELFGLQMLAGIVGAVGGSWFGSKTLKSCQLASRVEEIAAVADGQPQG